MEMRKSLARKITKWFVTRGEYDAPELGPRIVGFREGDDATRGEVVTSNVVKVDGRFVLTSSGSTYELRDADPKYLEHLAKSGYPFDPEHPIKVVDKLTELPQGRSIDRSAN